MTEDASLPAPGAPTPTRRVAIPAAVVVVGAVGGFAAAKAREHDTTGSGANSQYGAAGPTGGGRRLATLDQVPAGGGIVLTKDGIVLTRDNAGNVHGFSAVCTHQGCTVSEVSGGTINCPCHGSRFNATTGAPVAGPATSPLPPVGVAVSGGAIVTS